MTNFFASDCIFLIRENQTSKGSTVNVVERSCDSVEGATAYGQFDVTKAERSAEGIGGGRSGVFTGTVEVEKTDIGHIDDGMRHGGNGEYGDLVAVIN
jgi:hypothetical protein